MRYLFAILAMVMGIASLGTAHAGQAIADTDLGLSKASVFETPSPKAFSYSGASPGSGKILPRAYPGAPPQVPHDIESFLPLTLDNNMCISCHDRPEMMGKRQEGEPTPMPASHYTDLRHAPGKVRGKVVGARFVCVQCHVPQANVKPLVENTF
jgi:cytochrome c-type protein NapB